MQQHRTNEGISLLRLICCVLVVFMHVGFPGLYGKIIPYACRFPVSVFFMISGFYSCQKSTIWMWKKALYILKLLLICEFFYFLLNEIIGLLQGKDLLETTKNNLSNKQWWMIPFSGTLFCGPLWYLYAMFWTWILAIGSKRFFQRAYPSTTITISIVLLALALVLRYFFGGEANINYFRTGLLYGLPFFGLGMYLFWIEEQKVCPLSDKIALIIGGIGCALIICEYLIKPSMSDFKLSTVFTSVAVFCLAKNHPSLPRLKRLIFIGDNSMYIYLSHIAFRSVIGFCAEKVRVAETTWYAWLRPLLVVGLTVLFTIAVAMIRGRWKTSGLEK